MPKDSNFSSSQNGDSSRWVSFLNDVKAVQSTEVSNQTGKNIDYFLAEFSKYFPELLLPCPAWNCHSHVQHLLGESAYLERLNCS